MLKGRKAAADVAGKRVIHFSSGESRLNTISRQILDELGKFLNANKGIYIEIEGHTDRTNAEDTSSMADYKISLLRANNVYLYLIGKIKEL